jgi:hypothetical protein
VTKGRAACGEVAEDDSVPVSSGGLANAVVRIAPGVKVEERIATVVVPASGSATLELAYP